MLPIDLHHSPDYTIRKRLFKNYPAVFGMAVIVLAHLIAGLGYWITPDSTPNAANGENRIKRKPPGFRLQVIKVLENIDTVEEKSWWVRGMQGQESPYMIVPIEDNSVRFSNNGDSVFFKIKTTFRIPKSKEQTDSEAEEWLQKKDSSTVRIVTSSEGSYSLVEVVRSLSTIAADELKGADTIFKNAKYYTIIDTVFRETKSFVVDNTIFKKDTFRIGIKDSLVHYLNYKNAVESVTVKQLHKEFYEKHLDYFTYYLGTDSAGRDVLSRLLLGTRISLSIGFVAVLISLLVGVSLGAIAGFFGGWIDNIIFWLMTVVWSVPSIMLIIVFSMALSIYSGNSVREIWVVFVSVGLTMWVDIARNVRGEIMGIKQKLYVEAARAFGISNWRIIFKHILPNIMGSIIVLSASNFASAILLEAGLSFLGLGVMPPQPSWGSMINEGFKEITAPNTWHLVLFPSLCISLLVLAFNLFGNGLRDAYDPKSTDR